MLSKQDCIVLNGLEQTYFGMTCALNATHNTYEIDGEPADYSEIKQHETFRNCPIYSREDAFDQLIALDWDRHQAEKAMELVWLGRVCRMPEKLGDLQLPENLQSTASYCRYIFPRGSGAQRLILLMQLVWYLRKNPAAYYAAMKEKRL